MRSSIRRFFAFSPLVVACLPAFHAQAAGFQANEHSATGLGRAFAGEAAIAEDASVIARNPAGMAWLEGRTFTGAVSYVGPKVAVDQTVITQDGPVTTRDKNVADEQLVPTFYYSAPVNDQLTWGLGAFSNYGFRTTYGDSSLGALVASESELTSYNLNASLAWKVHESLSLGVGMSAVYAKGVFANATTRRPGSPVQDILHLSGNDWAPAGDIGLLWQPVQGTRIGIRHHTQVRTHLRGQARSGFPALNWNSSGSVDVELPAITEASIWQQLTDSLAVHGSYTHTNWSAFDQLDIRLDNGESVPSTPMNYNNSSRWALGGTWQYSPVVTLRAGYAYDNSPVGDHNRDFRVPDSDRQWFSMGGSYAFGSHHRVDLGYAYVNGSRESIEVAAPPLTGGPNTVNGRITKADAHLASIQYNYMF